MKLIDLKNDWYVSFENGLVQLIQIDFRTSLFIADGSEMVNLSIETEFLLRKNGKRFALKTSELAELAPVLSLFNTAVMSIKIKKTGLLTVEFGGDCFLEVEPDASYEAWQLGGSNDFMFVCSPGGPVSMFSRDRDPAKL